MKRSAPPPSPSSASSDDDRARLLAAVDHVEPPPQPPPPPRPQKRGRTSTHAKPPRAPSSTPPSPTSRPSKDPVSGRVAKLLDSYLETTLGPDAVAHDNPDDVASDVASEPSHAARDASKPPSRGVPFASIHADAAVHAFRLFNDSAPGHIPHRSKKRRLPPLSPASDVSPVRNDPDSRPSSAPRPRSDDITPHDAATPKPPRKPTDAISDDSNDPENQQNADHAVDDDDSDDDEEKAMVERCRTVVVDAPKQ